MLLTACISLAEQQVCPSPRPKFSHLILLVMTHVRFRAANSPAACRDTASCDLRTCRRALEELSQTAAHYVRKTLHATSAQRMHLL